MGDFFLAFPNHFFSEMKRLSPWYKLRYDLFRSALPDWPDRHDPSLDTFIIGEGDVKARTKETTNEREKDIVEPNQEKK